MFEQAEVVLRDVLPLLESNPKTYYQIKLELAFVKYRLGKYHEAHLLQKSLHEPEWCEVWTRLISFNGDNSWFLPCKDKVLCDQSVAGKSILVAGEGGIGDLLQFSRYMENLWKEGATVIYCQALRALHGLLKSWNISTCSFRLIQHLRIWLVRVIVLCGCCYRRRVIIDGATGRASYLGIPLCACTAKLRWEIGRKRLLK
ncbi:hypothetical protein [Collimonas arenae]|uniref:hypothetical protein n=1 Tax=Collimonas arenae TaxID=279058 RepID=UPI000571206B|nr:hypothetical protein [Collimonas arenae]